MPSGLINTVHALSFLMQLHIQIYQLIPAGLGNIDFSIMAKEKSKI